MNTAMVISPHADDAAAFCGATIAKFADQGWRVILVRVTDDRKDSVGLSIEETIQKNAEELREAARILGIHEIVELGFETDLLADIPLGLLRERIVYSQSLLPASDVVSLHTSHNRPCHRGLFDHRWFLPGLDPTRRNATDGTECSAS